MPHKTEWAKKRTIVVLFSLSANCKIRTCGISKIYDRLASGWFKPLIQVGIWSIHPESNRGSGCCRPVPYRLAMDAWLNNCNAVAVPKGVEPSSSGRQPDIISRYTTGPDGRNYWLRSSVSALSAQCSAIKLSSYMVGRVGFEPTYPEEADLQSAAFSHLRYLPKYAVHRKSIIPECVISKNNPKTPLKSRFRQFYDWIPNLHTLWRSRRPGL